MKKNLILISLCFVSIMLDAQNPTDKRGKLMLNGSIGFSYDKSTNNISNSLNSTNTRTILSLTPKIGYFFAEKIVGGIGIEYLNDNIRSDDNSSIMTKQVLNTALLAPFVRYYSTWGLWSQLQFGIGTSFSKNEFASSNGLLPSSVELKYNTYQCAFGFGYSHNLANNVAIEPLIEYVLLYNYKSDKRINKSNIIQLSVGLQFYL